MGWNGVLALYFVIAAVSFVPVFQAILKRVELHPGGDSFDKSHFKEKEKLIRHYSRLAGTLGFWKNQGLKYKRFHYYVLCWTIPSSVFIPIVTQMTKDGDGSKLFLTAMSAFTATLLAFHRGLKVEDNYKSYRHGESEFFDTYRRLLDRPEAFGETEEEQLNRYFIEVEAIRRYVRNAETDNLATMDNAKRKYEALQSGKVAG